MKLRLVHAVLLAMVFPAVAAAQSTMQELLMEQAGVDAYALRPAPSVRLAGMGEMSLAVADEANEISLRDLAGHVTGYLRDSDSWVIETWVTGNTQLGNLEGLAAERRFGSAGIEVVQRSQTRALGGLYHWTFYEQQDTPGDWSRTRGPVASLLVNQTLGAFTFGVLIGQESENEDRISDDFFALEHNQNRWVGQIGAAYDWRGWTLGAAWDFERGDVKGLSVDPSRFHEDSFFWTRPLDRYSLAILTPSGQLEGGMRFSTMDRDGGEEMEVSWSDRSPWNPSRSNYFADVITFDETESVTELLTRWRYHLGAGMVAAELVYRSEESEVDEGIGFKGSLREGAASEDGLAIALGASHTVLRGRLLVGAEGRLSQSDWDVTTPTTFVEATAQSATIRAGVEYFAKPSVVVRGGVLYTASDRDIDGPQSLARLQGVSGGFSWLPSGGLVQVHGAVRLLRQEPWDDEAADIEDLDETSYLLGLRLLL